MLKEEEESIEREKESGGPFRLYHKLFSVVLSSTGCWNWTLLELRK